MEIGNQRLKDMMDKKGFNVTQLAIKSGVSGSTIYGMLYKCKNVNLTKIAKIAEVLECNPDQIYTRVVSQKPKLSTITNQKLKDMMDKRGMTETELYKKAGVSFNTLFNALHRDVNTRDESIRKIAKALNCTPNEIQPDKASVTNPKLKSMMDKRGMTRKQLQFKSGVSSETLHNALYGNRYPSWKTMCKLAIALECEPHDIDISTKSTYHKPRPLWVLRSPNGETYKTTNLTAWVRSHIIFFDKNAKSVYDSFIHSKIVMKKGQKPKKINGWELVDYRD